MPYQVVVVSESPTRRVKLASFDRKDEAARYALRMPNDLSYEIVDDRTGLLKTIIGRGGVEQHILKPTRRDIVA